MNIDPLVVGPDVEVDNLAKEFAQHHRVNPIPVVDNERRLLGIVSRYDLIRFFNEKYVKKIMGDKDHGGILQRLERVGENGNIEIKNGYNGLMLSPWIKTLIMVGAAVVVYLAFTVWQLWNVQF